MRSIVLSLLAVVALGACSSIDPLSHPADYDYRLKHPVVVEPAIVSIDVASASGTLSQADTEQLDRMAGTYLARGKGKIEILAGAVGINDSRARALAGAVSQRLLLAGLHSAELAPSLVVDDPSIEPGSARVRFRSAVARLPECYDWTEGPMNAPSSNFGCAVQRNIGAMVANPDDLIGRRDAAPADGEHMSGTIDKYRVGQPSWGPTLPWSATSSSGGGSGGQ